MIASSVFLFHAAVSEMMLRKCVFIVKMSGGVRRWNKASKTRKSRQLMKIVLSVMEGLPALI